MIHVYHIARKKYATIERQRAVSAFALHTLPRPKRQNACICPLTDDIVQE